MPINDLVTISPGHALPDHVTYHISLSTCLVGYTSTWRYIQEVSTTYGFL